MSRINQYVTSSLEIQYFVILTSLYYYLIDNRLITGTLNSFIVGIINPLITCIIN